jgi:hypothetical protein
MLQYFVSRIRRLLQVWSALLLGGIAVSHAADNEAELRALLEQGNTEIETLKREIESRQADVDTAAKGQSANELNQAAVQKIIADYLRDNPGAGMPSSVQLGYSWGNGFFTRSVENPTYANWDDDSRIPFEVRFRLRANIEHDFYKVTDNLNHQTGQLVAPVGDFNQLELKRLRLIWEGTAFDPNLRYHFQLDGNTRGLGGFQNDKVVTIRGTTAPNTSPASPINGGVTVDHAVRFFAGYVAYDFHPCGSEKGCSPDCPEGRYRYAPTFSLIAGKLKPFFGLEEYLSFFNNELNEFSMADWYFDADDDNLLMAAGIQVKALEDRFYMQTILTNGNESQFPNTQMDNLPGFSVGLWYDLGGNWNEEKHKWDLFGDTLSDLEYSCRPVVRVGGSVNIVPMGRRSLYGDDEQSRVFVMPAAPNGTRLINVLNGDSLVPGGSHAVDSFDSYSYNAFLAGKYHGFSLSNEWWLRNLNNFRTTPNGLGNIIYQDTLGPGGAATNALFPAHGLLDYGMTLQGGYFVIPKKLQVVARWSWVRGESGDINGTGKFTTVTLPGVVGPVHVVDGAFRQFHEADEYGVGFNYYLKGQLLRLCTDLSFYEGGNPAGGAVSPGSFIPGVDGWLVRTRLQFAF